MTDHQQIREALKHGIKLLNHHGVAVGCMPLHEALAALSRLEAAAAAEYERGRQDGMKQEHALWKLARLGQEIEPAADHIVDANKKVAELSREDVVRQQFEAWADEADFNIRRDDTDKYREYHRTTTRWAWMAWQAASLVRSVPVEKNHE